MVGLKEDVEKNIAKRIPKVTQPVVKSIDLNKIPVDVLQRISTIVDEDEMKFALENYRKPSKSGNDSLCNCETYVYQSGGFAGIRCWLCGGYSY